jgi:dihydroflavonol-4-reductase
MNILVTGSTGFIGSSLCRALVERGHDVVAFHRPTSNHKMLEGLPVQHALGDLTRPDTIAEAMAGVEAVFHTAALLNGDETAGRMYTVTVEGTRAVLQAAQRAGVRRFIHTSSVAALGVPEKGLKYVLPLDEYHSWNIYPQHWPYGYAKHLAELEVQKAVARGLDAVIVNPSVVYGAGDIYRKSDSLIVAAVKRRIPALVEGGLNVVHINDVVEGHLAALERGRCGRRYILAGDNLTIVQLVKMIGEITQAPVPALVLPGRVARQLVFPMRLIRSFIDLPIAYHTLYLAGYHFYYDNSRAQVELGINPPARAEEALREAYDWFVEVGAIQKKG